MFSGSYFFLRDRSPGNLMFSGTYFFLRDRSPGNLMFLGTYFFLRDSLSGKTPEIEHVKSLLATRLDLLNLFL
jgi:hypothetical protein